MSTNLTEPQIQIRRAVPLDASAISALLHEAFLEYKSLYTDGGFAATTPSSEQIMNRMQEGPVWAALRGDAIVGTVSGVSHKESLYVRGMAVQPTARRFGIGILLLRTIEDFALANGYARLSLSTTPFLNPAIRLYERFGFQPTCEGPHELFGTPLFTMAKTLAMQPPV